MTASTNPMTTNTATADATPEQPADLRGALALTHELIDLSNRAQTPVQVGDAHFVMVPDGHEFKPITQDVTNAGLTPRRKTGTVQLGDIDSLILYAKDQDQPAQGYIYADPDARTITAVFNDQRSGNGWRDHRASFTAELTPEYTLWSRNNKRKMPQAEFAEFIEDNIADLQGAEGTNLLAVATTIQASTGIAFSSARRLQDGQTQLTYNETIDAKAGTDGALKIPQMFELGLRLFKNGPGFKIKARLKYRLGGGAVNFWYELDRPERALEAAFDEYVQAVREKSGYAVLIGKAG